MYGFGDIDGGMDEAEIIDKKAEEAKEAEEIKKAQEKKK